MVFDATTAAFPQRSIPPAQPVINPPILSAAKPATPQSSDTANRPSKRRRINELQMPTPVTTPSPAPELDLDALDAARRRSSARVMSLWESLAARYARALDEDDEIDILTGKIYRDRGVLRSASERGWKIGSFGGAMEVEPVSGVSEGETETGTSEADDEGDGEGAGDAEEGDEDDPFETWSYDWQYRAVSPPKPELSPKDAEDLEEFLATERAIQEEAKLKGKCLDPVEDEDDIVYLGDSLHDEDGALRDDETSDDEFASFMVDSSTIRLKDEDDEDEDEEVGPMSSILGSLAIGGSRSNRTLDDAPTQGAGGKGHTATKHLPNAKPRTDAHESTTSPPSLSHTHSKSSNIAAPASETGVEDELIVIDSDSDEELDADLTPRCQPKPSSPVTLSTSTASSSSKPLIRLEMPATSSPALVRSCAALTLSETSTLALPLDTSAPSSKSTKPSKPSFSAMVALLEASATTSAPKSEASTSLKSAAKPSSSTNTGATVSKRMLPKNAPRGQGLDAAASKGERHAPPSPAHRQPALAMSAKWPKATSLTDAPANAPTGTPKTSDSASKPTSSARAKGKEKAVLPSKRATSPFKQGKPPQSSAGRLPKAKIGMAGPITGDDKLNDKSNFDRSAASDQTVVSSSSSTSSRAPKPVSSASAPTAPLPATRLESPTKSRKKALILEVVLPIPRQTSKSTPQSANSIAHPASAKPASSTFPVSPTKRALPQMGEYASGSEAKLQIEFTLSNKSEPEKDEVVVVGTRVRPNSKRKRLRESGEGVKAEDVLLGPLMKDKSVEQAKDRMYPSVPSPPVPFPQGQPPGYYPMPFGYFPYPPPPLPPHAHPHAHAAAYASWSHQVHHCSTQQQHQHTHAPYPFPQSSLAPNQLTEASFGFMYGYAAMPHAPGASGSTGHSVWYPPGAHIPYPMPPVNQTEGALQVSPPKLEQVSSSQEEVPDSQERVPSSQEHEREKEKRDAQPGLVQPASEKRMRSPLPCPQVEPGPEAEPIRSMPAPENAAIPRPITPTNLKSNNIPHTPPVAAGPPSPAPKAPIFQRESSVIDIDSDSDDELAEYNAGEGSMRWEPPIKDEEDSDEDGGLDLSAEMDGSDDDILLLGKPTCIDGRPLKRRLRKSPGKVDHKSRTSPLKLRTL